MCPSEKAKEKEGDGERGRKCLPLFYALTKLLGHGDELSWPVEISNIGQGNAPLEGGRPEMNCVGWGRSDSDNEYGQRLGGSFLYSE
jgi:hypothetical protein